MISVRDPEDAERAELLRMTRQAIGRVSQRAQMVLLSAAGRSVPELAAIFGMSRVSIRFWLRRFDLGGPAALYDAPRSGRPRSLDQDELHLLTRLIDTDPHQVDATTQRTTWTIAMLTLALIMRL